MNSPLFPKLRKHASALVITLSILVLITVIIVGYVSGVMFETKTSRSALNQQKAHELATLAMHQAMAKLRSALGPWDDPFTNFMGTASKPGTPPSYFWSISPGRLTQWSFSSVTSSSNIALFSGDPTYSGTDNLVNLNNRCSDGSYPIIGGTTHPPVSVQWVNVLQDPSAAASATNQIIGRYAFWIDDENSKININTADGTNKDDPTKSLGVGTPTEVSLQVLSGTAAGNISATTAANIVQIARTTGFHSVGELQRAQGVTTDVLTSNVFNLTCCSRSPELNVFGEPKLSLIPASVTSANPSAMSGWIRINNITSQPLTEIYPTPYQLPPFTVSGRPNAFINGGSNAFRPLVMVQEWPIEAYTLTGHNFQADRGGWAMSMVSLYLGGTNSMGKAIQWPVFAGSGTNGLKGKYSLRQLDSLSVQICDLAQKSITPEAVPVTGPGSSPNSFTFSVPSCYPGLLSNQLVPGIGRSAKVNEVLLNVNTFGPDTSGTSPHPEMQMYIYLKFCLPAGFGGVDLLNKNNGLPPASSPISTGNSYGTYELGAGKGIYVGALNVLDMPLGVTTTGGTAGYNENGPNPSVPVYTNADGSLTTQNAHSQYSRKVPQADLSVPYSCWQDTILMNDGGVDFFGNSAANLEPDQYRAKLYHPYSLYSGTNPNYSGKYFGSCTGSAYTSLLRMGSLSTSAGPNSSFNGSGASPWYPGQYRTVTNWETGSSTYYPLKPGATRINFSGGLIITGFTRGGGQIDPDPVPFEAAVRGQNPWAKSFSSYDYESFDDSAWKYTPGDPAQTTQPTDGAKTVRDRVAPGSDSAGVIPVEFGVDIPSSSLDPGNTGWYDIQVADPLVNKFPGDWTGKYSVSNNSSAGALPTTTGGIAYSYNCANSSSIDNSLTYKDPDSFWMPTLDPSIPRSARMPNIGYLQYLRTGVIPDDETVPLKSQHGTPYRLVNFAPSDDDSQAGAITPYRTNAYKYPDWAILDLFTIPSTLLPYNGPYGYYKNGVWTGGSVMTGNPQTLYSYGTYGGATSGRINPNGTVIYTKNVNVPEADVSRNIPLQATFHGLKVNQTISSGQSAATATVSAPIFTGGTAVDETGIAQAVESYIRTNGPLREPAEICNVGAISALFPNDSTHNNRTRNDLIRQVIGNFTTQSNVFSVWVAGQVIQKIPSHRDYGHFEAGDNVLSFTRYHFIVERYLDPGINGVYGNIKVSGSDGLIGTYDDPSDSYSHPANPRYLYRVVFSEEVK